jgi:hypothetical protein
MEDRFLSEAHSLKIGRLTVNVSKIDSLLTDLVSTFSGTHIIYAVIMVHHQQIANKIDTLLAIMRVLFSDMSETDLKVMTRPVTEARAVSDFRNTVVHAMWTIDDQGNGTAVKFQARGNFKTSRFPLSVEDIQKQVEKARALVLNLSKMRDHFQKTPTEKTQ